MARKYLLVFCLALAAFHGNPAWSQTKHEPSGAWSRGIHKAAPQVRASYGKLFIAAGKRHGIPDAYLGGVALVETSGKPHVRGGLTQAGRSAERATGIRCDTRIPRCSIEVSAAYLAYLRNTYGLDWPHVLLAYNRGPNGARHIRNPYAQQYVQRFIIATAAYNDTR